MLRLLVLTLLTQCALWSAPPSRPIWLAYGDSKTQRYEWEPLLRTNVPALDAPMWTSTAMWGALGRAGATVASMKALVDGDLLYMPKTPAPDYLLFNLGVNDIGAGLPAEAVWEANVLYIIDAFRVRYPNVKVYLMRPWYRAHLAEANTLAGWIDVIVAARPGIAFVGPDERVWMAGNDDGATMTTDGTHYSAAGNAECARQWQTVLGY
jgi:lysophospholipase L1-like esterase